MRENYVKDINPFYIVTENHDFPSKYNNNNRAFHPF